MNIFRLICFFTLLAINGIVCTYLWNFVLIASIARYLVGILLSCNLLVLVDIESNMLRGIIYLLMAIIMILGLVYAVFCRHPLGFFLIFSAGIVITKNLFIQQIEKVKESTVSKMIFSCLVITIIVFLGCFSYQFKKAE